MIGVHGQFLISFGLNDVRDFIRTEDFRLFHICEEAGNVLPKFKLTFDTDTENMPQLNEMSDLSVSMGSDMDTMLPTQLYITEVNTGRIGDRRRVACQGLLATPGYISNTKTGVTGKKSGLEVVQSVASRYFQFDTNIGASVDRQNWVQNNLPDKQFLQNAWMSSHLPGSFPAIGISAIANTFILRDMASHAVSAAQWQFVPVDEPQSAYSQLPYHGDYTVRNTSGFVNSTFGYATDQPTFNIDKGMSDMIQGVASSLMSGASSLMARGAAGGVDAVRKGLWSAKTGNMHDNYHQAKRTNARQLAVSSSFKVTLSFSKRFRPIRVLDTAFFLEDSSNTPMAAEYASGQYVISKVERFFTAYQHATRVEMTRDGPGGR